MDNSKILVAQIGARRNHAVARALDKMGVLECLITDFNPNPVLERWVKKMTSRFSDDPKLRRFFERSVPGLSGEQVTSVPLYRMLMFYLNLRRTSHTDWWAARNAAFCGEVVRRGFAAADIVYAFNGAALEIFRAARQRGLRTILDQTAAPWRWNACLLYEEVRRWPGWEDRPAELDESGMLSEREEREWELADTIVCGSDFCRSTLIESGVPAQKCRVVHYPMGIIVDRSLPAQGVKRNESMHVLFAGTLQLRKGIPYLYEAAQLLSGESIEFRLVGPSLLSEEANRKLRRYCEVIGAVPRSLMMHHYEWADVLVLPTLSEGSANVCHEAMAAGLPVITTPASGSRVLDRINGLVVPAKDAGALAEAIAWMAKHPNARARFGEAAKAAWKSSVDNDAYPGQLRSVLAHIGVKSQEHQVVI